MLPITNSTLMDTLDEEVLTESRLYTVETGRLIHGCGNPDAEDYNSLADFCFGKDFVEVRIPWLLLNFGDPAHNLAAKDFYANYGTELGKVKKIYLGAGTEGEISMAAYKLTGWKGSLEYRERLKESYDVLQAHWQE